MPTLSIMIKALLLLLPLSLPIFPLLAPAPEAQDQPRQALTAELEAAFQAQGIQLELERGTLAVPAEVCIREELLEYVLVGPQGAAHESLFATGVSPTVLNAALVALGAVPGENVRWVEKNPPPTPEEVRDGAPTHDIVPPKGDAFLMYVAWREGEEIYFFRLEDLITNLRFGRSMRRHGWIYLGSRMVQPDPGKAEEVLAAEILGNLINLSYFRAGNTLFTAALDDCVHQTIWVPNSALVPGRGAPVTLIFSRRPLKSLPETLEAALVDTGPGEPAAGAGSGAEGEG